MAVVVARSEETDGEHWNNTNNLVGRSVVGMQHSTLPPLAVVMWQVVVLMEVEEAGSRSACTATREVMVWRMLTLMLR